jgi:hypothetical protein
MLRKAGALLAIVMLLGLGSCPVPVRTLAGADSSMLDNAAAAPGGSPTAQAGSVDPSGGMGGSASPTRTAVPGTDSLPTPETQVAPDALPVGPQAPGAPAGQQVGPQLDTGAPGPQSAQAMPVGPTTPAASGPTQEPSGSGLQGPVQSVPPPPQYGALDAENFMGDAPAQTVWGQPKPQLSEDALSFAGRWLVAVIHRQGDARMLDNNAEWVLELGRDGAFFAKQDRGGQTWRQSGTWELKGMQLVLHSGPGGERTYELSQEMDNLCVLRDPARETALFCVRDAASAKPAAVQAKYDTDFGVLNLRPAGPGHWRGSYGEPAGTLLLAQLGRFLVGSWEQAPSKGFVLLELREGGFAGAWLYQSSVYFDGRWVGVAAQ